MSDNSVKNSSEVAERPTEQRFLPKNLFHVLITDGGAYEPLPARVARNLQSAQEYHPTAKRSLLNNEDVSAIIRGNFGADVLNAYEKLSPYAYKSDLARYCLLYLYGGLYADVGVRFVETVSAPAGVKLVAFRDVSPRHLALSNGVILAEPRQPEFKTAIELVVANCAEEYYGSNPLAPTGPAMFARALAINNNSKSYLIGDLRSVTPEFPRQNNAFITGEGRLVALGKPFEGGGDLTEFGLSGTNNYNDFWWQGQVYGDLAECWSFDRPEIKTRIAPKTERGVVFLLGMRGMVIFGPYIPVLPGTYSVTMDFDESTNLTGGIVEVVASKGKLTLKIISEDELRLNERHQLAFEFSTANSIRDLEVRLKVFGTSEGCFKKLSMFRKKRNKPHGGDGKLR